MPTTARGNLHWLPKAWIRYRAQPQMGKCVPPSVIDIGNVRWHKHLNQILAFFRKQPRLTKSLRVSKWGTAASPETSIPRNWSDASVSELTVTSAIRMLRVESRYTGKVSPAKGPAGPWRDSTARKLCTPIEKTTLTHTRTMRYVITRPSQESCELAWLFRLRWRRVAVKLPRLAVLDPMRHDDRGLDIWRVGREQFDYRVKRG